MNEIYQLQQLDKKLAPVNISKPRKGWLATIRKALGMSQAQFGRRLGVSRARANKIENSELDGSLTLASLERAAHALGCKVHYMLLPENESLVAYVQQQARHIATKAILGAAKQMALEDQSALDTVEEQIDALTDELLHNKLKALWNDIP